MAKIVQAHRAAQEQARRDAEAARENAARVQTARAKAAKAESARYEAFRAELAGAQPARAEAAKAAAEKAESDEVAHENAVGVKKRKQGSKQHNLPPKEKSQSNHRPQTLNQNERLGRSGGTRPRETKRSAMLAIKPEMSKKSVSLVKPTTLEKPRLPQQEELRAAVKKGCK